MAGERIQGISMGCRVEGRTPPPPLPQSEVIEHVGSCTYATIVPAPPCKSCGKGMGYVKGTSWACQHTECPSQGCSKKLESEE
jgi:hypothetical protein